MACHYCCNCQQPALQRWQCTRCKMLNLFVCAYVSAGRPWYTNLRPLAVPVVAGYVIICIMYIVIRAARSIQNISAPGYGILILVMEALGMVSLLQAGLNHLYKVRTHLRGHMHHIKISEAATSGNLHIDLQQRTRTDITKTKQLSVRHLSRTDLCFCTRMR